MMENFEKIDVDVNSLVEAPFNGEPLPNISTEKSEKLVSSQESGEDSVVSSEVANKIVGLSNMTKIRGSKRTWAQRRQRIKEKKAQKKIARLARLQGSSRGSSGRGDLARGSCGRGGRIIEIINYQYSGRAPFRTSTYGSEVGYRKATDLGITMAVIHKMHPNITLHRAQGDLIEAKLEQLIDALPVGGPPPQFNSTRFQEGAFWVTCANESTKDWLVETVAGLESLWEGGYLMAVSEQDMPKRQKVRVWIPGSSAEEDAVRNRLVIQNPSLNTDDWQPLSRKVVEKGQTIAFSVDESSFEALKQLDFRPYWNLGRLNFSVLSN